MHFYILLISTLCIGATVARTPAEYVAELPSCSVRCNCLMTDESIGDACSLLPTILMLVQRLGRMPQTGRRGV
ncbi:hypothetical protein K505DRAFT_136413 [Melanomma pulvis-pyrius CBS 109.77]|uniref:Hydrophobin n=1 Tax=Melanomma pulvis-pyrius CBS 109.77 TaxID=1314802 RepID=A0A6A6XM31_9PLEO|nr:hypothetical protein K505DRAFT_136413 [Melanomma pulvis-pyrius CBS 109.77]